jgi:hypothetical protein
MVDWCRTCGNHCRQCGFAVGYSIAHVMQTLAAFFNGFGDG